MTESPSSKPTVQRGQNYSRSYDAGHINGFLSPRTRELIKALESSGTAFRGSMALRQPIHHDHWHQLTLLANPSPKAPFGFQGRCLARDIDPRRLAVNTLKRTSQNQTSFFFIKRRACVRPQTDRHPRHLYRYRTPVGLSSFI